MVDWSYELLDEEERRLFCGLSVFSGGFTLEACVAVCGPEAGAERDAIDVLGSLVDKSLVAAPSAEAARGEPRFRQLETLREYAAEKLRERGEAAVRFAAFGRWALELVTAAHAQWVTAPRADWEARFKLEVENVRAAVEWAFERDGDVALGLRIVTWARRMFGALAPREGLRLTELAQRARVPGGEASADGAPDEATVELTFAEAQMNIALRRPAAAPERARVAAAAFTALGNEEFGREAQIIVGYALVLLGRGTEAKRELYEAQAYFERAQLVQFCGVIASDLGVAYAIDEKFDEARASFNAALHWFRRANNSRGIRVVVTNLAEMEFRGGSAESAIERISAELTRSGRADALLSNLSAYLIAAGRFDQALEYGREAILAAEASGSEADTLLSLQHVAAAMLLEEGESAKRQEWPSDAARLIGFVDARIGGNGAAREFTERQEYDRITSTLQQIFDAPTLVCLFREGADWDERVAVAVALST